MNTRASSCLSACLSSLCLCAPPMPANQHEPPAPSSHHHPPPPSPAQQLLCGEHSRATGARYGEQSRRSKASKKGALQSAAAKAKKAKRVVKRKGSLW